MTNPAPCSSLAHVDTHFAGHLLPEAERALWAHLPTCPACTARYERQLVLESLDPAAPGAEARMFRGLGLPARRRLVNARVAVSLAALVTVAAVVLLGFGRPLSRDGFYPRGAVSGPAATFEIYRVPSDASTASAGHWATVGDTISRSDALAFAYANPTSKRNVLIFAVDERKRVYWYHPAWTRPDETPEAIPVAPGADLVELPEAIVHPFDASSLRIYAVFVDEKLTVRDIESRVADAPALSPSLGIDGAVETSRLVEVR